MLGQLMEHMHKVEAHSKAQSRPHDDQVLRKLDDLINFHGSKTGDHKKSILERESETLVEASKAGVIVSDTKREDEFLRKKLAEYQRNKERIR